MVVFSQQTERELIGNGFAFTLGARSQKLFNAYCRYACGRMRGEPFRVAATGAMAGNIDEIFDGESQTAERAVLRWWKRELLDERAGLFH